MLIISTQDDSFNKPVATAKYFYEIYVKQVGFISVINFFRIIKLPSPDNFLSMLSFYNSNKGARKTIKIFQDLSATAIMLIFSESKISIRGFSFVNIPLSSITEL